MSWPKMPWIILFHITAGTEAGWVLFWLLWKQSRKTILHPLLMLSTDSAQGLILISGNGFYDKTELAKTLAPNLFSQKDNFLYSGLYDLSIVNFVALEV